MVMMPRGVKEQSIKSSFMSPELGSHGFLGFLKMKLLSYKAVGYIPWLKPPGTFAIRQRKATRDFRC